MTEEATTERRETFLGCPKCFKRFGHIKEPKSKKTFTCPKHGRFETTVRWYPEGWEGTMQYFVRTRRKGK